MFDRLPLDIRETIFSRVHYVDLFETARVPKGWWTLTMASFERVIHARDDFLLDQVDFCNEMMPQKEPWEWWMLMEFTKSKRLYLAKNDFRELVNQGEGKLIQYFKEMEVKVKHLTVEKNMRWVDEFLQLPSNLNQLFPDLNSIELNGVEFLDGSDVVLPSKLKVVKLNCVQTQSKTSLSSMITDPSELKVLHLTGFRSDVYFDGRNCHKLTNLSIDATYLWANDETDVILILSSILNENKGLKSVSLQSANITKEWMKMFPLHVVKLELQDPHLSLDLIRVFGNNVLYERMTLFYIHEDWKSVAEFKSSQMTWDKDLQEDEAAEYQIQYVCRPNMNQEHIEVYSKRENVALNDVILRKNQGLVLTSLTCAIENIPHAVPQTVHNLNVGWPYYSEEILRFEDSSNLETLILNPRDSFIIDLHAVSNMRNLRKLHLGSCDSHLLECFLVSCKSLTDLTLERPRFHVFRDITSDIQNVFVQRLRVVGGGDTFDDILDHLLFLNTLILEKHNTCSILKSNVHAVSDLQYFKAVFERNKEVAVHLSSLKFPYMLFACDDNYDIFAASQGMELINEISVNVSENNKVNAETSLVLSKYYRGRELSLVYTKNVATRFLRIPRFVVNTVKDFIAKQTT